MLSLAVVHIFWNGPALATFHQWIDCLLEPITHKFSDFPMKTCTFKTRPGLVVLGTNVSYFASNVTNSKIYSKFLVLSVRPVAFMNFQAKLKFCYKCIQSMLETFPQDEACSRSSVLCVNCGINI